MATGNSLGGCRGRDVTRPGWKAAGDGGLCGLALVEPLEERLLLSGGGPPDLTCTFMAPSHEIRQPFVPGDSDSVSLLVRNWASSDDRAAMGNLTVQFYGSSDTVVDSSDVLLKTLHPYVFIQPNDSDIVTTRLTIPQNAVPGNYYVLARVNGDHLIGEANYNNDSTSSDRGTLVWKFGTFLDTAGKPRTVPKLTVQDENGIPVTFTLSGPGYGTVDSKGFGTINFTSTTTATSVGITTSAAGGAVHMHRIGETNICSLASLQAPKISMVETVYLSGTVGTMSLWSARGIILLLGSGNGPALTLNVGTASNLTLSSYIGVKAINAGSWTNSPATYISTQWIGSFKVKGDLRGLDVSPSGDRNGYGLQTLSVGGTVADCTFGKADNRLKSISSITVGSWQVSNMVGRSVGKWVIKGGPGLLGDMLDSTIALDTSSILGVYRLGSLTVANGILGSAITSYSTGNVGPVKARYMLDSWLLVGFVPDSYATPMKGGHVQSGQTIKSITITGTSGNFAFARSWVGASGIGSVKLGSVLTDYAGREFGFITENEIGSFSCPMPSIAVKKPLYIPNGDFTIVVNRLANL